MSTQGIKLSLVALISFFHSGSKLINLIVGRWRSLVLILLSMVWCLVLGVVVLVLVGVALVGLVVGVVVVVLG